MKAFCFIFGLFTTVLGLGALGLWMQMFDEIGLPAILAGVYFVPVCGVTMVLPWMMLGDM